MTLLAAVAAACAVALAFPGPGRGLARLSVPADPRPGPEWRDRVWPWHRRRRADAERARVVEFAGALAAEVRTGRPPRAAVVAALDGQPTAPWSPALLAAATGDGDVGAALDQAADGPGSADLRDVAACWRVAERTGAGLGTALEAVAAAAGERTAHEGQVRAQLAGARTTGWVLAALPVVGMTLAGLAGARPWEVLLGSPGGFGLLVLGVALDLGGVAWLRRLARRVEAVG